MKIPLVALASVDAEGRSRPTLNPSRQCAMLSREAANLRLARERRGPAGVIRLRPQPALAILEPKRAKELRARSRSFFALPPTDRAQHRPYVDYRFLNSAELKESLRSHVRQVRLLQSTYRRTLA